jgi:folate-binding Fe-S cluster repair protein YgfZ
MTSHIDVHGKMLIHIMMYEHDELKSISIHIDQLQMQELYEMIAMYYDHKKATK